MRKNRLNFKLLTLAHFIYSVSELASQSIRQSVSYSINQSVSHSVSHSFSQSVSQLPSQSGSQSASHPSIHPSTHPSIHSFIYSFRRSVSHPFIYSFRRSVSHPGCSAPVYKHQTYRNRLNLLQKWYWKRSFGAALSRCTLWWTNAEMARTYDLIWFN